LATLVLGTDLHLVLFMTENLHIYENLQSYPDWKGGIENTGWLELLLPFTTVKDLYPTRQFAPRIASALQELTGERRTEVLPKLQNMFLSHRNQSMKELDSSFLRDSSPIALPPFRHGRDSTEASYEVHD